VHNTTQNSSDNLPSYLQTNITAQVLSIGGEGWTHKNSVVKRISKKVSFEREVTDDKRHEDENDGQQNDNW